MTECTHRLGRGATLTFLLGLWSGLGMAGTFDVSDAFAACAITKPDAARLKCYDKLRDDIVAREAAATRAQAKNTNEYRQIALIDLKLDAKELKGKRVATSGYLQIMGDLALLKSEPMDTAPLWADISALPREHRKAVLQRCASICEVSVRGVLVMAPLGATVKLDSLQIQ